MNRYLKEVRHCAKGLPLLLVLHYDWRGYWRELRDAWYSTVGLFALVLTVLLYPISVFVLPAIGMLMERRDARRMAAYRARADVKKAWGIEE